MIPAVEASGADNMLQLIQLRWIAVAGQFITILLTRHLLRIDVPVLPMFGVLSALVLLNAVSMVWLWRGRGISGGALLAALLLDVAGLSAQLYLSGGATNPFVSLFLLHVVLGSILLDRHHAWVVVVVTTVAVATLMVRYRRLPLPAHETGRLFPLHIQGMWVCFALIGVLLVLFVTRINANVRARDARLAAMQRHAVEEDHIVRMGLLASGAAHELGTPLASLSVILGDWRRMPALAADADLSRDLHEMQAAVQRCKTIVTNILLAAGEARGEASGPTTVRRFFADAAEGWRTARGFAGLDYRDRFGADVPIVSDAVLRQMVDNLLDNAAEAGAAAIEVDLGRDGDMLVLTVADRGSGFTPDMLEAIGRPYRSTKAKRGGGLGLFLVTNLIRKLDGTVTARNREGGGAEIVVRFPLASLALTEAADGG